MISTSTTLSNPVGGGIAAAAPGSVQQPVKTSTIFSGQKGSDSFLPGRQLLLGTFEDYIESSAGQGETEQPVKTPTIFTNQKGSDSFLPGRQLTLSVFEDYIESSVGQGEFLVTQTGTIFNTSASPTFIVPRKATSVRLEKPIMTNWLPMAVPPFTLKPTLPTISRLLGKNSTTFVLASVLLPVTLKEVYMTPVSNDGASSSSIRQIWG